MKETKSAISFKNLLYSSKKKAFIMLVTQSNAEPGFKTPVHAYAVYFSKKRKDWMFYTIETNELCKEGRAEPIKDTFYDSVLQFAAECMFYSLESFSHKINCTLPALQTHKKNLF